MTKHLSTLSSISHLASISCCRRSVSFLSVMSRCNTQSSASKEFYVAVGDRLVQVVDVCHKQDGAQDSARWDPLVTGLGVEVSPSSSTRWVLSFRKAVIQARLLLRTPYQSSL